MLPRRVSAYSELSIWRRVPRGDMGATGLGSSAVTFGILLEPEVAGANAFVDEV